MVASWQQLTSQYPPDIRVSCQDAHDTCTSGGYWDVNCCQDATITFTNVGTGPTETLALVDVDQHPEFTISNDTCTGTVLAPGESCSFLWTYSAHCFNDSYVPVDNSS